MSSQFPIWMVRSSLFMLMLLWAESPALARSNDLSRASTLAEIAFEYAEADHPERAVVMLEQAEALMSEAATKDCYGATRLLKIGAGYLAAGQSDQGEQFLTQAFEIARDRTAENCHSSATSPQESLLNRALEYAEAGHFDLALQIANGATDGIDPITLTGIAGHYSAAGQQRQAEQTLNQAITQAVEIAQQSPEDPAVNQLLPLMAAILSQAEQPELAEIVIETALPQGKEIAAFGNLETYQTLNVVQLLADLNRPQQALALLETAVTKIQPAADFPQQATYDLVEATLLYHSLGQREQADEVLAKAQQISDASTQAILVGGYANLGEFDQARALAASIESAHERQRAYSLIAAEYAKAGLTEEATGLVQSIGNPEFARLDMMRAYLETEDYAQAQKIALQPDMLDFLPEVGQAYLDMGEPEQALSLIDSIPSADSADWLRQSTAIEFARQNEFDQALKLAQTVTDPEIKADVLAAIAANYTKSSDDSSWGRLWTRLVNPLRAWLGTSDQERAVEILDQAVDVMQIDTE